MVTSGRHWFKQVIITLLHNLYKMKYNIIKKVRYRCILVLERKTKTQKGTSGGAQWECKQCEVSLYCTIYITNNLTHKLYTNKKGVFVGYFRRQKGTRLEEGHYDDLSLQSVLYFLNFVHLPEQSPRLFRRQWI